MDNEPLDIYDELPEDMKVYLRYNGRHFNRRLLDFAITNMSNKEGNIRPITKETLEQLINRYNVRIDNPNNATIYDMTYVANMCKSDFLGSSITDEEHLIKYVKDVIDDSDGYEGLVFTRWYADCCRKGIYIDWYEYR